MREAAVRVFGERGFRAASMRDLADAVGLSKSAVYHYVTSKEDLLVELYEGVLIDSINRAERIVASNSNDVLAEVLIDRVVYTCENKRLLQIFFEEEAELPAALQQKLVRKRQRYQDLVLTLIERGVKENRLRLPTTPSIFVNVALGAANWVYKWYDPDGRLSPRELGEQITAVLLAGVTDMGCVRGEELQAIPVHSQPYTSTGVDPPLST